MKKIMNTTLLALTLSAPTMAFANGAPDCNAAAEGKAVQVREAAKDGKVEAIGELGAPEAAKLTREQRNVLIKNAMAIFVKDPKIAALVKENPDVVFYIAVNHIAGTTTPELKNFSRVVLLHSRVYYADKGIFGKSQAKKIAERGESEDAYVERVDQAAKDAMMNPDEARAIEAWRNSISIDGEFADFKLGPEIDPAGIYDSAKARNEFSGIKGIVQKIQNILARISHEMRLDYMDASLMALNGFLRQPEIKEYSVRRWGAAEKYSPSDILMPMSSFMSVAAMGLEIEQPFTDPTTGYPWETATYFTIKLPAIANFVGQTTDQFNPDPRSKNPEFDPDKKVCSRSWCNEERRHPALWRGILASMTGKVLAYDEFQGNAVAPFKLTPEGIRQHSLDRMTSEIGASASYLMAVENTQGGTQAQILNMTQDELKHLAIFAVANQYLLGYRPMMRRAEIAKVLIGYAKLHQAERSAGADLTSSLSTNMQMLASLIGVEETIQQYAATVPLQTMRDIFEGPYTREPDLTTLSAREKAKLEVDRAKSKIDRFVLSDWTAQQRSYYLTKEILEETQSQALEDIIFTKGFGMYFKPTADQLNDPGFIPRIRDNLKELIKPEDLRAISQIPTWSHLYEKLNNLGTELENADFTYIRASADEMQNTATGKETERVSRDRAIAHQNAYITSTISKLPKPAKVTRDMVIDAIFGIIRKNQIKNNPTHLDIIGQGPAKTDG